MSFLSGATGDPINTKNRIAEQPVNGVPLNMSAAKSDFRIWGSPIVMSLSEIERLALSGTGEPLGILPGKLNLPTLDLDFGDVDLTDRGQMHMWANLFRAYDHDDVTTYQRWWFYRGAQLASGGAAYNRSTLWHDNDVLPRMRLHDLIVGGITLTASPDSNLQMVCNVAGAEMDFNGAVAQTVGSGSTLPVFRRNWGADDETGNWAADATDQDVYVRKNSHSSNNIVVSVKVGAGSAYSATQTVVAGEWTRLYDESGAKIGKRREQLMIYWPVGFTLTDTDEFTVSKRTAAWTPSLPTTRPAASVNSLMFYNGSEMRIEGNWEISSAWDNINPRPDIHGAQGATVYTTGALRTRVSIAKDVIDLKIQRRLLSGEATVSLVMDVETDVEIAGASRPYRMLRVMPQCRHSGPTFGTEAGGTNREESFTLVAEVPDASFEYDSLTFTAHDTTVIENDATALNFEDES
jgi:hypothetical protein